MLPMVSYMASNLAGPSPPRPATEMLLDDVSRHISIPQQTRRYSRGSTGYAQNGHVHGHGRGLTQQHIGTAMRVVKPSTSANNSPRSAVMQARRKTVVNDGLLARRNQQLLEQAFLPSNVSELSCKDPIKRTVRPVSWHPSSQLGQLPQQQFYPQQPLPQQQTSPMPQYPFPSYNELDFFAQYQQQFPPTPAVYSGYSSPTAFSPLSLPFSTFETPQYALGDDWAAGPAEQSTLAVSPPTDCPGLVEQSSSCTQDSATSASSDASSQWASFVQDGFDKSAAAPPTPDNYPTAPPAGPVISSDEAIPFQPLEDEEEEGEILVGMGLYDPPEKPLTDATLDNYRASVAHLLGSSYNYPEPTGKGLKLEDPWEPPAKEEDDDEEDTEGGEDAEGEEQE